MQVVDIQGTPRTDLGKKSNKAIRRDGGIPCVIYGIDEPVHFSTTIADVKDMIFTPDFKVASITVDGKSYRCILKDIQFHPVTENVQHLDFLGLKDGRTVRVEVPVKFKGESPGEKQGGKIIQSLRRLKIKAAPENLVSELFLDISELELGHSIRVRDTELPEGIEVLNAPSIPVASVEVPRALKEGDDEEEGVDGAVVEGGEVTTEE